MSFVSESNFSITKVLLIAGLIVLTGCEQSVTPAQKKTSDLLIYCAEGSPVTLNPQTSTSGTTVDAASATIFNQLIDYIPGTTELRPSLATNWQISDDGTRYQFELRQGVKFHSNQYFSPSRELNADDVIFSINRQRQSNHPLHALYGANYPYFKGQGLGSLIKNIKKIDDYQIEIELTRSESPFLSILATPFIPIQSQEYAEFLINRAQLELFDKFPIGTGPFQFVAYETDSYIRFKRFDEHFAFVSPIQNLVYAITPDPAMRFARFSAGECDMMRYPLPVHMKLAQQDAAIESIQTPALNVAYWAFNTEKEPFNNPKVRQALGLAINRKAIIRSVYDNQATLAEGPLGPNSWAYDQDTVATQYNPERAKQLLTEAGYDKGFELDIWAMPVQRAYNPNARKMAEMIQQDLLEVGVKSNIVSYQWGSFLRRVRLGHHQTVLLGWNADNGDPNNFLTPLLSCLASKNRSNYARWCDQNFDSLILQARQETSLDMRKDYYIKAQKLFAEAKPWLPIAHTPNNMLVQNNIKGVTLSPLGTMSFEGIYFASDQTNSEQPKTMIDANEKAADEGNKETLQQPNIKPQINKEQG
ncbi:MAG: ABC transporter substrate-binding protein [Gammaproteobacteria bacterium]|nr:ABC transporter substrate-binding protein [Gammaproteobacteria bacterium]